MWDDPKLRWNRKSARLTLQGIKEEQTVMSFTHLLVCLFMTENVDKAHLHLSLILSFFGLLRILNITISSTSSFDPTRNTQIQDITDNGESLNIFLRWSKTNQTGSDSLVLPKADTEVLCPVRAWRAYKNNYLDSSVNVQGPLIQEKENGGYVPVTGDKLRHRFKDLFSESGLGAEKYTPHTGNFARIWNIHRQLTRGHRRSTHRQTHRCMRWPARFMGYLRASTHQSTRLLVRNRWRSMR